MSDIKKAKVPQLNRILELQSFVQNFHYIERVVHLSDTSERRESDTEHSYSLAMMAWFVALHFPELDTNKCIRLALVHDLVEIYAGDTFTFGDKELIASKAQRELAALERIEKEWPDFKELSDDIHEYENLETPESSFVFALDKIIPSIVIYLGGGKTWRDHSITLEQIREVKERKVKSPLVLHYYDELFEILETLPHYFPDKKNTP